ncbi:MAG TPA: YihY/virulence factor BrkB family protein [Candidatus Nanopelagicales bacterium]|nr:YihY/virulence factor BrkB family protein [Candidatus Nanopelagicales bacterium]
MSIVQRAREQVRVARSRSAVADHAVRAVDRQSEVLGGQLAAAITYYGFLSFFPLLALAFSLVGFIADDFPGAQDAVTSTVQDAFPTLVGHGAGQLDIQDVIDARAGAGIIGLVGLLYAGLGWLDAVRDALRRVFGVGGDQPSLVRRKLVDVVVLSMLGASLLGSIVVSSMATAATTFVLDLASLDKSPAATAVLKVLSVSIALAVDFVIVAILLSRLSGARLPWRRVRSGALLGAAGFEVLKLLGTFLVGRTTDNPVYATFGVVVGLLVWMNLVSRLLVFTACWAATQPYSLEPSGIGGPGVGRTTGLAWTTEPVSAVAPGDYDAVPVADEVGSPSSRRGSWRGVLVGAGAGAAAAALVTRRRSARSRG